MTTKREDIADKIRALRSKASNVASTEAEAAQAAAMIAKLLAKHDMTEADVSEYQADGTAALQGSLEDVIHEALRSCWRGICDLTETKAYLNARNRLCFIGMEHDLEMALYLSEIISSAADRALKSGFPKATPFQKRSFYAGFGAALNERLKALAAERKSAKTATGTAIVIVKDALVKSFLDEAGLNLRQKRSRGTKADAAYYGAGRTVGGAMNLTRPLAGSSSGSTARIA